MDTFHLSFIRFSDMHAGEFYEIVIIFYLLSLFDHRLFQKENQKNCLNCCIHFCIRGRAEFPYESKSVGVQCTTQSDMFNFFYHMVYEIASTKF